MDSSEQPNVGSQNIVNLLEQFSSSGLTFEQAKEKLISYGYTETEITSATDDYDYGSKQASDISTKAADYFESHPDKAVEDGKDLLIAKRKEDLTAEQNQAVLDAVASTAAGQLGVGNTDAQVEYESKFASDVGISFWLLLVLGIVVDGMVYFLLTLLQINNWFYSINGVLSLVIVIFLIKRMK